METSNSIIKSILSYSKSQRIGIILFFLIIILVQGFYYFFDFNKIGSFNKEQSEWLSYQSSIDSVKFQDKNYRPTIYPFNPNFITDFKGYKLGMSVVEIDRLLSYRKQNKFVNSAEEFQAVTKVSDSLLKVISPYFKFPDWIKDKKQFPSTVVNEDKIAIIDINQATKDDLMKIKGIGPGYSELILKEKQTLGGFVSMEQMQDVWGLSPEVVQSLNKYFKIGQNPAVKKIDINNATVKELAQFHNFRTALAKEIVTYRSMNGDIKIEDLSKIKGFPVDKIKIIALYLEF